MIRKAKKTDIEIISKIYIDSRRKTYKNILPDDYLNSLTYAQAEKKWIYISSWREWSLCKIQQRKKVLSGRSYGK